MVTRPVPDPLGQRFGENPTGNLPPTDPTIQQFGNYQPDGHTGEDYRCGLGSPVRAVASGTVLHVGWMAGTYADNPWWISPGFAGYCAVIDHGAFIGIYGHCTDGSAQVTAGQRVSEGQVFILSGNTGGSTGPHLHFEILPDGYVLSSKFYGRIDPETIFAGGVSTAGTITPVQEDDVTTPEQMLELKTFTQACVNDAVTKMWETAEVTHKLVQAVPATVLNAPIPRGGGLSGETTLASVTAWHDAHVNMVIDAVAKVAPGADLDAIKAAVREGLAAGVHVDATVTVAAA